HVAFHAASAPPVAYESDKERFVGRHGSLGSPAAMGATRLSNGAGRWQDPIGSLQVPVRLARGASVEVAFTLGVAATRREALPLAPEQARKQILLHAAHQFVDGTAYHWWHPLTEEGARKKLNDDLLWLPFVTLNYLRETADLGILEAWVPYLEEDGARARARG